MKRYHAVMLFVMTLACSLALGQTNTAPLAAAGQALSTDAQVVLLREQVALQKEFTSDILNTVYFTLGVTLAVLLAMVGFGWYQGHRAYERDKEDLSKLATEVAKSSVQSATAEVERGLKERFEHFDANIAKALEASHRNLMTHRMCQSAALFNATHLPATPRTDFIVLLSALCASIGKVDEDALKQALGVVIEFLESRDSVDGPTRTHIAELSQSLPPSLAAQANRLAEVLAVKK